MQLYDEKCQLLIKFDEDAKTRKEEQEKNIILKNRTAFIRFIYKLIYKLIYFRVIAQIRLGNVNSRNTFLFPKIGLSRSPR